MIVCYEGRQEILITTLDKEQKLRDDYFHNADRDFDDYDRYLADGVLEVTPNTRIRGDHMDMVDLAK